MLDLAVSHCAVQYWARLGLALPTCVMPCHSTIHHAMLCLLMLCCAMPCCAWLHIAVPYQAVLCGARALLTRLGGWCGAEQVATSRSHWRVSSSQHPSDDPGDREHASACRGSQGTAGSLVSRTCCQVGDSGCLCVHKQQVL